MLAVDANVLVRVLARDGAAQADAASRFIATGAWVSHLVLAETVWALESVFGRAPAQLIAALQLLLAHESLVLQDADTVAAALEHFRRRPALGFSDCLVLAIARKAAHSPLGTFDRGLARLPGARKL